MNKKTISIAIDGPVGSGKGTLAVALAEKIDALYVYTGAMYRELALACLREKVDINDEEKVIEVLDKISISFKPMIGGIRAFLNNEDVSSEIFKPYVSKAVPVVAALPKVRKEMVLRQKKMANDSIKSGRSVVMEGRDITTDVIPDADIKIYLTADIGTRIQRRVKQLSERGIEASFDEVSKGIEDRDRQDSQRNASPLRIAENAVIIDTTNDTIDQTVEKVIEKLKEKSLV
jgi:CMP/dCMP kinase